MSKRNSSKFNNLNNINNRNSSKQQRHLDSEHGDDYSQQQFGNKLPSIKSDQNGAFKQMFQKEQSKQKQKRNKFFSTAQTNAQNFDHEFSDEEEEAKGGLLAFNDFELLPKMKETQQFKTGPDFANMATMNYNPQMSKTVFNNQIAAKM